MEVVGQFRINESPKKPKRCREIYSLMERLNNIKKFENKSNKIVLLLKSNGNANYVTKIKKIHNFSKEILRIFEVKYPKI